MLCVPLRLLLLLVVRLFILTNELPPLHLVLAPMPLEQLRQNPLRLLELVSRHRQMPGQRIGHLSDALQSALELLARLGERRAWARDGLAETLLRLEPQLLEPIAQPERRKAVIAIV